MNTNNLSATDQPTVGFTSDNIAGTSPQVLEALARCNVGQESPYGNDEYTQNFERMLSDIFETDVSIFLVPTGSAANALCLSVLSPPWGSILCHPESHINNDECGAPEFFTHGAKLVSVEGDNAKIDPEQLKAKIRNKVGDVHSVQPSVVSITQATETGSIYSVAEVEEIGAICRNAGVRLHMDGARFANALVALDCSPAEVTWKAGVDALSFGATKNGVLAAEAIILFDKSLATEMGYRRKRGGHLCSKMRFLSAQIDAYLRDDLWLKNARHANDMAARLSAGLSAIEGIELAGQTESNIIFCRLPQDVIDNLISQGFRFYHDRWGPGMVRLVTMFSTQPDDVDHFVSATNQLLS